jgi:hypothetical protein
LRGAFGILDVGVFGIRSVERLRIHGLPPRKLLGPTYNIKTKTQVNYVTYFGA